MTNWDFLKEKFDTQTIAHAYLLSGGVQEEKRNLIKEFVKYIHCQDSHKPCQKCIYCAMVDRGNFADFLIVKKLDDKNDIVIDQVKKIQNFLSYTPYYGGFKTILVENSDLMNLEAQNSFLKTLEEPRGKSIIFLSADKSDFLLPTVASRCQVLNFFEGPLQESKDDQQELLQLLTVLKKNLAEKFQYAKDFDADGKSVQNILQLMERHFRNLLLQDLENKSVRNTLKLLDNINKKLAFTNINQKLALEVLLLDIGS